MASMGYLVIQEPVRYRQLPSFGHSVKALRRVTDIIVTVLAGKHGRNGRVGGFFRRGLVRLHFFGDKKPGQWNPHWNVLVDAGYLTPETLDAIREALRSALHMPGLVVNYSYRQTPPEMLHTLRYVTRSTFRQFEWDERMARELKGFRNMRQWGSWKDALAWSINETDDEDAGALTVAAALGSGVCPACGKKLHKWSRPFNVVRLEYAGARECPGTGYYFIPPSGRPPLSDDRWWDTLARRQRVDALRGRELELYEKHLTEQLAAEDLEWHNDEGLLPEGEDDA